MPTLQVRLERQLELACRLGHPYLGHMQIETDGRVADVLLAEESGLCGGLSLLDWRRAPLAEVFFACAEGEEYEVESGARTAAGRLLQRNLVVFRHGQLDEVHTPAAVLRRRDGAWTASPPAASLLAGVEGGGLGRRVPLLSELDDEQRRAVQLPAGAATLITGEAGSGKTTVALHRLAHLARAARGRFRCLVLLPSPGLQQVAAGMLHTLGVHGAEVRTYDEWASEQARRSFPDLPARESRDAGAGVIALKRHPALIPVLDAFARRPPARPDPEGPFRHESSPALARHADLEHLFGDRMLMERVAADSGGSVGARAVAETLEHTHVQFSITAEEEYDFVDPDRLVTLDRGRLDDGTPMEDASSIDIEDYPVLFELDRMRAARGRGHAAAPERCDCVVIDEAQELAPLELRLAGRAVAPGGTLIVSGDDAQQVDPTSWFSGWPELMRQLGAPAHEHVSLEVGYRSAPAIRGFTRAIARAAALPAPAPEISVLELASEAHLLDWLIGELRARERLAPSTSVAVIFRDAEHLGRLQHALRRATAVRVADGETELRAGACLTTVAGVKGLELDAAIVVDASAARYPATPQDRHALYVATTRARQRLILTAVGAFSALLPVQAQLSSST